MKGFEPWDENAIKEYHHIVVNRFFDSVNELIIVMRSNGMYPVKDTRKLISELNSVVARNLMLARARDPKADEK